MQTSIPCLVGLLLVAFLGMPTAQADSKGTPTVSFSQREEIEKRLSAARDELKAVPPDVDPELNQLLQRLAASCEYHLSPLELLTAMRDDQARAKEEDSSWTGFASPPPYQIRLLDEIRESIASLENTQRISEAQIHIFEREIESLGDTRATHQQAERRFLEAAENQTSATLQADRRRSAKIENIQARIIAERIGHCQLRIDTEKSHFAATAERMALATRKLKALDDRIVFSQGELDEIVQQIARERERISKVLMTVTQSKRAPDPLLTWRLEFLDLKRNFWGSRFTALNNPNGTTFRESLATLKSQRDRVDDWVKVTELRLSGGNAEIRDFDPEQLRDSVLELRAMQRRITFAISDLDSFSLSKRGTPLLDRIINTVKSIWNAELYFVEESDIVEGKKIPIYRAITMGKVLRLAFILVVGWLLLGFISRRTKARVLKNSAIPQSTADMIGKWAFGTGLFLLVLYALNAVRIPLTAFAFLGGALAIGVGFGTQTILKNFISGIIILFERPLKVGDVVEVSTITGTIQKIGMRASVIRHFDGIETLVPNSILLENQLTNWTFSSTIIRHSVIIGVAYGSPTREVASVLLAVAASHGLVKKDPPPEVRFDDFGADALNFTLLFWLDTRKIARNQLASDLRYMIDKALSDAGITIAFPQRDIHFDRDVPLRVELARKPATIHQTENKSDTIPAS